MHGIICTICIISIICIIFIMGIKCIKCIKCIICQPLQGGLPASIAAWPYIHSSWASGGLAG